MQIVQLRLIRWTHVGGLLELIPTRKPGEHFTDVCNASSVGPFQAATT